VAHHTEQAGFPAIPLNAGMKLRVRALSPTADAVITGVSATEYSIYGYDESGLLDEGDSPRWVPEELQGQGV
jgi:hypothetical protein